MAKKASTKVQNTKSKPAAASKEAASKKKPSAAAKPVKPAKPAVPVKSKTVAPKKTPVLSSPAKSETKPAATSAKSTIPASMARREENDVDLLSEEELARFKSGLTKKDLEHYRSVLLEKRAEILGDVDSLQTDSRNKNESGDHFSPEHMADVGSEYWEQEFNMGLVESEQRLLREIIDALIRIDKGIYGVCMQTGEPIGKPRLDAKPWAKFCIAVAREKERRGIKLV